MHCPGAPDRCVCALPPPPQGSPKPQAWREGRSFSGGRDFSNKESRMAFHLLDQPLPGPPAMPPQPLRALIPPGPGPSTLLPSFLPTETHLDGSQLGGWLVHLGRCRDFSNQRFPSLLQSILTPGGHTPGVSCWALPSTTLHGHQPVHCFPAPAATYLPMLLESSDLRALLLLTFPRAP